MDSEQATEACHSQFDIFFKRYSPPSDKKSPEYEKRLKKAVVDFNDTNLLWFYVKLSLTNVKNSILLLTHQNTV